MSAINGAAVQTRESFIRKHPLPAFFALAIGLTWIFLITDALGSHGILPFRLPLPLLILTGYMPTLAAVIVQRATKGGRGVKDLFRKLLIWRVGIGWYAFAIFGFAIICPAVVVIYNLLGVGPALPILSAKTMSLSGPALIPSILLLFVVTGIVNGEELAWRGFALPRLQAKYNALQSSLILGVPWTVFHIPLFFTTTGSSQANMSFLSFLVMTLGLTVLYTWVFNHTRGSVLLAYLFHASANTWTQVFTVDHTNATLDWIMAGVIVLLAVAVVGIAGSENLSRSTRRIQEA